MVPASFPKFGGVDLRPVTVLVPIVLVIALAAPALAGPVNPVANGGFEIYAPFGAALLAGTPVDGAGVGVGRQALGCTHSATLVWGSDCDGASRDRADTAAALASDPQGELDAWLASGYREGDLAIVAPADQGVWYATNWAQYPPNSIAFGDMDGDGDREARILAGNQMLYQSFGSASAHTALPAGLVRSVTAAFEEGAPAGRFVFVLDSFPLESAVDWPQAFINYQLSIPASAWAFADGVVTIDPLQGKLSGPAAGAWILPDADEHPSAADWSAAGPEERRAMLMEFRITQFTFWNLGVGTQVDDVAFDVSG
jgi:hypothetical protein